MKVPVTLGSPSVSQGTFDNILGSTQQILDVSLKAINRIPKLKKVEKRAKWSQFLRDAEGVMKKASYQYASILRLYEPFDADGPMVIDTSSIYVLVRALFENVVTFTYVFGQKKLDETDFWHATWRLYGILKRKKQLTQQGFAKDARPLGERFPELAQGNEELIRRDTARLRATSKYAKLTPAQKAKAEQGLWRRVENFENPGRDLGWVTLATAAGLPPKLGGLPYEWGCSHSHSESVAIFQIQDPDGARVANLQAGALIKASIYQCHALLTYIKIYPELKKYAPVAEFIAKANRWNTLLFPTD